MSKLKLAYLSLSLIMLILIGSCTGKVVRQVSPDDCFRSFDDFAYSLPEWEPNTKIDTVLPPSPWTIQATLPTQKYEDFVLFDVNVVTSRPLGDQMEIWISQYLFASNSGQHNKNIFLTYQPASQTWKTISSEIGDTGSFVWDLFVTNDNSVWGGLVSYPASENDTLTKGPILSKFNESTLRFEAAPGILEIENESLQNYSGRPKIVLDAQDIFWIFINNDGIYRYDPSTQMVEKWADLPDITITEVSLSPDGSIFFEKYDDRIYSKESFFRLVDGMIFQFIPESGKIVTLDVPNEPWPVHSGILADHNNRLWLGAIGYKESDDSWHLIHPNPENYFDHAGDIYWSPPHIMLESSDGTLWYIKPLDGDLRAQGTAWYDPQVGKGCMFTNLAVNIIEDSHQQLWLVADGKLYKNSLNP